MRSTLLRALALLAPAMILLGSSTQGQELQYPEATTQGVVPSSYFAGSDDGRYYYTADDQQQPSSTPAAAPAAQAANGGACGCNTCGCNSCGCGCDGDDYCAACEDCPCSGIYLFSGFESFKGFSDGSYQSNFGVQNGFNYGSRLGAISEATGIGGQFGMSYNIYDWNGRFPSNAENTQAQTQLFVTGGLFRKANENSNWSGGVAYDVVLNNNWGVYSSEPYLTQWRGQLGYALSECNEVGVWGAFHDKGFSQSIAPGSATFVSYRSVAQANVYWHHKFDWGTDSWVWVGAPEHSKLGTGAAGNGSLGDFIIGTTIQAPIGPRLALYGSAAYMHPSAGTGASASVEETWYVSTGLAFYPRCNARTRTVSGQCWMPLMPVANNGNFMVDASTTR